MHIYSLFYLLWIQTVLGLEYVPNIKQLNLLLFPDIRELIFLFLHFAAPIKPGKTAYQLSPYLNYNPVYLPASQPEFIFPEGASRQRGRFELAFSQIGSSCMIGAAFGGLAGTYNGLKATTLLGQTGKLRRTQYVWFINDYFL